MNADKAPPASIPEPPPQPGKEQVTPKLIDAIKKSNLGTEMKKYLISLVQARDAYGFGKYKTHLETFNGRNMLTDAEQELGDFLQYGYACILEKRKDPEIERLFLDMLTIGGFLHTEWTEMMSKETKIVSRCRSHSQ